MDFRGDLIAEITGIGFDVVVATAQAKPEDQARIESLGVKCLSYPIQRNGMNAFRDMLTCVALRRLFREVSPDITLAYTIKPIIWGGIAARLTTKTKFFALVTGLGFAFQGDSFKRRLLNALVSQLYRVALSRADGVIFQNHDNKNIFIERGIVPAQKCSVVSGSGVNTTHYSQEPLPPANCTFLLIARLLGEKGIREYIAAARKVKSEFADARFLLVGPADPSPDGISLEEVEAWHREGIIEYLGATKDVRPYIEQCHVYCLPSYHEGMPRTVLEAMAMGRPILTTNVSGCKETVEQGINGWLVPHADVNALADRMNWFVSNQEKLQVMGAASRKIAEEKFDVRKVNEQMLRIMGIVE